MYNNKLLLVAIIDESYTTKYDIFSFTIALWEMLARKVPTIDVSAAQLNSYAILFQMVQGKYKIKENLISQCIHWMEGIYLVCCYCFNKNIMQ